MAKKKQKEAISNEALVLNDDMLSLRLTGTFVVVLDSNWGPMSFRSTGNVEEATELLRFLIARHPTYPVEAQGDLEQSVLAGLLAEADAIE